MVSAALWQPKHRAGGPVSDQSHDKRSAPLVRWRSLDATALGASRPAGADGHEVRLRSGPVRRVHGACRRRGDAQLRHADERARGQSRDDDRRPRGAGPGASVAVGLEGSPRGAVRVLPERADHAGGDAPGRRSQAQRRGHRRTHGGQPVPVRDVPANSRGYQGRCREDGDERADRGFAAHVSRLFVQRERVRAWHEARAGRSHRSDRLAHEPTSLAAGRIPRNRRGWHGRHHRASLRDGQRHPHQPADGRRRGARSRLGARAHRAGHRRSEVRLAKHRRLVFDEGFLRRDARGRSQRPDDAGTGCGRVMESSGRGGHRARPCRGARADGPLAALRDAGRERGETVRAAPAVAALQGRRNRIV